MKGAFHATYSWVIGKNPTGAIFNLKNNYAWKDKTEVDSKHTGNLNIIEKTYPPNGNK